MTATNHVLTGALIGASLHNPWLVLPVALSAHFVLDALPHFGIVNIRYEELYFKVGLLVDMSIAALILALLVLLVHKQTWLIVSAGILCASPDLMWLPQYMAANRHQPPPKLGIIATFHRRIQWFERPIGIVVEVAWCLAILILLDAKLHIIR
jgi:hypothetical protein